MNDPGFSLFQGSGSIRVDNERQEEEEFLAEEKKRKDELVNMFQSAFDDLIEDDEDDGSLESSHYSVGSRPDYNRHYSIHDLDDDDGQRSVGSLSQSTNPSFHRQENFTKSRSRSVLAEKPYQNGGFGPGTNPRTHYERYSPNVIRPPVSDIQDLYKHADNIDQLRILYEMRLREIERLNNELEAEKGCKDQILRQLAISEKEKETLDLAWAQDRESLAESKKRIADLESDISKFKDDIKKIEKSRDEIKRESDIAKMRILSLEEQISLMERVDVTGRGKCIDGIVEALNSKHSKELNCLQREIDEITRKLGVKEEAYAQLELKLEALESKHTESLIKKCDSTVRQEAVVKVLLDEANAEKLQLTKKVNSLENEVAMLRHDLAEYDLMRKRRLFTTSSSDELDDSVIIMGLPNRKSDEGFRSVSDSSNFATKMKKDELQRALAGQQQKRTEIRRLQEQIQAKELQLSQMREKEKKYISETENLKKDMANILERLGQSGDSEKFTLHEKWKQTEAQLQQVTKERAEYAEKTCQLELQLKHYEEKVTSLETKMEEQSEEYMAFHDREMAKLKSDSDAAFEKMDKEWKNKMESLLSECNDVKSLYIEVCTIKEDLAKKLEEEKLKFSGCSKEKAELENTCKLLQNKIASLEDHILRLKDSQHGHENQNDPSAVTSLKEEIERLKAEISNSKIVNPADLQNLVDEVAAAKKRYVDLQKRLETDYEVTMNKLKVDNAKLKEELKEKEKEISRLSLSTKHKSEKSSLTELYLEEISDLEKEMERLRASEKTKNEEIIKMKHTFEQSLELKRAELEEALTSQYKLQLEKAVEQVKSTSVNYYTEQLEKLQRAHKEEMGQLTRAGRLKMESDNSETQKTEELANQLKALQSQMAGYKAKTSETLTHWAKEFEEVNQQKENALQQLDEMRDQLGKMKAKAVKYKKRAEDLKASRIPEKYKSLMDIVATKEIEFNSKLQELADVFKVKEIDGRNS